MPMPNQPLAQAYRENFYYALGAIPLLYFLGPIIASNRPWWYLLPFCWFWLLIDPIIRRIRRRLLDRAKTIPAILGCNLLLMCVLAACFIAFTLAHNSFETRFILHSH